MPGGVEILEEAEVDRPTPDGQRRPWAVPLAAFVVGAFAGAVFFGPVAAPAPETAPENPVTPLAPGEEDGSPGVGRAVPGFEQAIVAVVSTPIGVEYLVWPVARSPSTVGLPVANASSATIDPSGMLLGTLTPLPDADGNLLSSGRSTAVRPVMTGVDSYAWHDSAVGRMAILRHDEGSWRIYEAAAFPDPEFRVDLGSDHPGALVGFGSWGWALQGTNSFDVVTGSSRTTHTGEFLDASPAGFLVADRGSVHLWVDGETFELASRDATAGRFSPDGTRAAILDADGVTIVTLDHSGAMGEEYYAMPPGADQIEWAGNRFVIVPRSSRGLWVLDTETGDTSAHLTDYQVSWSGTITLR